MVSVIIPNYNHARFLDERIQSILNQTYQDFEIMILDDSSTDNSMEVISRYKDHPKVTKIVVNEHNSGSPFKQWQKGISMANGEVIWIAESDDNCEPTFLETLMKKYDEEKAVLAFCKSVIIDQNGEKHSNYFQDELTDSFVMEGEAFIRQYLAFKPYVQNISSAIFCKAVAQRVADQFTSYRVAGDWLFSIEIAKEGKVVFQQQALNMFRIHNANTTFSEMKNGNVARETKQIYDYLLAVGHISDKDYRWHRKDRMRQIHFSGFSEPTRNELLNMWGASKKDRLWLRMLSVYNRLLLIKKRL